MTAQAVCSMELITHYYEGDGCSKIWGTIMEFAWMAGGKPQRPQATLPEPRLRFALQPPKYEAEALHIPFQLYISALYISSAMPRKIWNIKVQYIF